MPSKECCGSRLASGYASSQSDYLHLLSNPRREIVLWSVLYRSLPNNSWNHFRDCEMRVCLSLSSTTSGEQQKPGSKARY
jgi:hypothetical protein